MDERFDTLIAQLASRQHGVVGYQQLVALGLGRGAVAARVAAGRLHRLHVGVFAVGHTRLSAAGRRMAAVLACGRGAVLSHHTAAAHWNLRQTSSPRIHVTVPTTSGRGRRAGIVVHRSRRLRPQDVTVLDGVPVTSVGRTLLDMSTALDAAALRKMLEQAERLQLLDRRAIEDSIAGRATRRLVAALAEVDPAPVRSDLESDFLALCREHGVPRPEVNTLVVGLEVDCLWRAERLVAEVDGWDTHSGRTSFRDDRRRDVKLALASIQVVRFTAEDIRGVPAQTAATLLTLLAARAEGVSSRSSM